MKKNLLVSTGILLLSSMIMVSCTGKKPGISEAKELNGAGATFPKVLYEKYFDQYYQQKQVQVNYQAVGSGAGINTLIEKTIDFGATDAPMKADEEEKAGSSVIHIPTSLGAVVLTYNLDGNPKLKLNATAISGIFLGTITKWNDPLLQQLNPEVNLPSADIAVIHRSDGSGTTYTFTEYLTKADPNWKKALGTGKTVNWPVGLGGKGNDGVAGLLMQTPYSIGYVELIYATQNNLPYALVQNKTGNFVEPTMESVSKAADTTLPDDLKVSITDTNAAEGYPISTFTWIILYREQRYNNRDIAKAKAAYNLLWWMIHEGQEINETLQFGRLPDLAVQKAERLIQQITFDGKALP